MAQNCTLLDPKTEEEEVSRGLSTTTPTSLPPLADSVETDIPTNGGYGWVCVACVFGINAHTWGIISVGALFCLSLFNNC